MTAFGREVLLSWLKWIAKPPAKQTAGTMLTDAKIQRELKAGKNRTLSDGKGKGTGRLLLIIRGHTAEWYAQQWLRGKRRLSKIGSYPQTSLAEARRKFAEQYEGAIQSKADIRAAKYDKPGTVAELFASYTAYLQNAGKPSWVDADYNLKRVLEVMDGSTPANQLRTDDVTRVLRPIYNRGAKSMADHVRGYIRSAYGWAIKTENDYRNDRPKRFQIRENPAASIPTEPKVAGNRWLSVDELRAFWRWLYVREPHNRRAQHVVSESNQRALRVLVVTGQRVEMVTSIRAAMLEDGCVFWPTTKTGVPHFLPLPEQAKRDMVHANEHGWFFPRQTDPTEHVTDGVIYSVTQRFCDRMGVDSFAPRDLRRTWKTLAGQAGLTKSERDLLQCHARSDVSSRHYDRYEYLKEKRAAMERWSEWFRDEIEKAT